MPNFFDARQIVEPKSLIGPRVYSTDLFPSLYDSREPAESLATASRALKTKLITKGVVTLNSVYLMSPAAVALFESDHTLFDGDGIVPAFRDDHTGLTQLADLNREALRTAGIEDSRIKEHQAKLEASLKRVMPWNLAENGELLRKILLGKLEDDASRISIELEKAGFSKTARNGLVEKIKSTDMSSSANVRGLMVVEPNAAERLLNAFLAASYHQVGAAVVNCEVGTDLSPLSTFKAADIVLSARSADGMLQLTEEAIFLDTFAATAMAAIQGFVAGDSIIDAIDFGTAHKLSAALREQGFQEEYDRAVQKVLATTSFNAANADDIDVDDITHSVEKLHQAFSNAITDELREYKTQTQRDAQQKIVAVGADLLRDVAGQVPGVSNLVSLFDAVQHGAQGVEAGWRMVTLRDAQQALVNGAQARKEKMNSAINTLYAGRSSKSKLLDGAAAMIDLYVKAIERV